MMTAIFGTLLAVAAGFTVQRHGWAYSVVTLLLLVAAMVMLVINRG